MKGSRARQAVLWLTGLGLALFLVGWQIDDYPFRKTQFGAAEGTRKVYKNLSDAEIKAVMQEMADGIGVKCDYCHNEKNYASEEKPMKDFARKKIFMLDWMNHKYRPPKAKWEYTCYTCHRGQVKPVPQAAPPAPGAKKKP